MEDVKIIAVPQVSGIDALYYFAQSGGGYDRFYENIIEQIEDKKREFELLDYNYADNDIIVTINDIDIMFSGKGRDGFYWFNHKFFRVGFKDSEKSKNIHNIRVQLNGVGIYTLGIKSQLEYINEKLLNGALLESRYFPITRIDVNMFIQHNFNYLRKEMILSKKKTHSANITEHSSGYELETYYVGKKPFMLRIYNKLSELKNASNIKREIMLNHFAVNGLDIEKDIFNIEFELHREFLKQYGIDTIDDALNNSKTLFEHGCSLIKLIDINSISEKQLYSSNRKRADILPIWEYVSNSYDCKEFMQIDTPLQKIEKISYRYSLEDARKPIERTIMRLLLHDSSPTLLYFLELLDDTKKKFEDRQAIKAIHQTHKDDEDSIKIKSEIDIFSNSLSSYSDEGLMKLDEKLSSEMKNVNIGTKEYEILLHQYNHLNDEQVKRELVDFPF